MLQYQMTVERPPGVSPLAWTAGVFSTATGPAAFILLRPSFVTFFLWIFTFLSPLNRFCSVHTDTAQGCILFRKTVTSHALLRHKLLALGHRNKSHQRNVQVWNLKMWIQMWKLKIVNSFSFFFFCTAQLDDGCAESSIWRSVVQWRD